MRVLSPTHAMLCVLNAIKSNVGKAYGFIAGGGISSMDWWDY